MIKVSDDYSIHRDQYQWILSHFKDGKDKDGNPKRQCEKTYHANIPQVATKILELSSGKCSSMEGLMALYSNAVEVLADEIDHHVEKVHD